VDDAGFGAIEMHVLEVMRRMPASVASVVETMARAPYARDVAAVEEAVRQAIEQEVSAALHAYRDGDEVVIPPFKPSGPSTGRMSRCARAPMKAACQPSIHDTERMSICGMKPIW